jgi:hypothetical protein
LEKTWGDHAPAEIRILEQGISETALVEVLRMRILDKSSLMSFPREIALAGWWSWMPRERQISRRNLQRRSGSLFSHISSYCNFQIMKSILF